MKNFRGQDYQLSGLEIAIIGLACRFPGAGNVDEFWQNLRNGVESVSFFTDDELASAGIDPLLLKTSNYVKARGLIEDAGLFDANFFGYNPKEAEIIDPQQRFLLECSWEALENAGYDAEQYKGLIGVYAGVGVNSYLINNILPNKDLLRSIGILQINLANDKDFVTGRISYKLNLKGPGLSVQTACSTSLTAVHLACQGLLSGDCDIALAGGCTISSPQKTGYLYQEEGILSPDGHCRSFDASAQGTIHGDGVGVVVLKRLADAIEDGDFITAVLKGTAINSDGAGKVGFTAPGIDGQTDVIARALAMAEVNPETITYVEAHGTATPLGDPIEIRALTQCFRRWTEKKGFCALGSVKTNIGHTDSAAGVAGLIKTALALKNKELPPSLHFNQPNPKIDFENSPFYVNRDLSDWDSGNIPRRAGVSSFGMGSTNAHAILEEPPDREPSSESRPLHLLILSARTSSALDTMTTNLAEHLDTTRDISLADVAYTLQVGRKSFNYRRTLVCNDLNDAVSVLKQVDPNRYNTAYHDPSSKQVTFMFPGQGAQYINMGLEIYRNEKTFRSYVDECAELLTPHLGLDLRKIIYPDQINTEESEQRLKQTDITQPALFVIEYSLARLLMEWGIQPQAMIGHSIGEYVAACLAGVFSLQDALLIVAERGRLMQQQPGGSMLAVGAESGLIETQLDEALSLAAINAPSLCVISGPEDTVNTFAARMVKQKIQCRPLHTSHAFHSAMMEQVTKLFPSLFQGVTLKSPKLPFISNLTGTWITSAEATSPDYWAAHLRNTVRFADGLETLQEEPEQLLLEVGPGSTLQTLAKQASKSSDKAGIVSVMRHPKNLDSDVEILLNAIGQLWLNGIQPDWPGFYSHQKRVRIALPSYPFERKRFWVEKPAAGKADTYVQDKGSGKISDPGKWFYVPCWKSSFLPPVRKTAGEELSGKNWLVLEDSCGLGLEVIRRLESMGCHTVSVKKGEVFANPGTGTYTINSLNPDDYKLLIQEMVQRGLSPENIVFLWSISGLEDASTGGEFYSLLYLTQALEDAGILDPVGITIVTREAQHILADDKLFEPQRATVQGLCRVIPQEYPHIRCRNIDIVVENGEQAMSDISEILLQELSVRSRDVSVAYRDQQRWVQSFDPLSLEKRPLSELPLRQGGVYLITGGLGNIGFELARYLAKNLQAKLVLTGRSELARQAEAGQDVHGGREDLLDEKARQVAALEELGAEVLVAAADVADAVQMKTLIKQAEKRFGGLNGVIHGAGQITGRSIKPIRDLDHAACEEQFRPKITGTLVLNELLRNKKLDFRILMSSLSSILGGLSFGAYASANAFQDFFAHYCQITGKERWLCIDWDGWQFDGDKLSTRSVAAQLALTPEEGIASFERLLAVHQLPQIIVSTAELGGRLDQWVRFDIEGPAFEEKPDEISSPSHERPALDQPYVKPRHEIDELIAKIWTDLLGIKTIGIQDNFFDLGGHSLLGTQLINKIYERFEVRISLQLLFESPRIEDLSDLVIIRMLDQESLENVEQMFYEAEQQTGVQVKSEKDDPESGHT